MKRIDKKYLILLTLGAFVMSFSFILTHYVTVTDAVDGFLKGTGLGLMILGLIVLAKKKKQLQHTR